VTGAAIPPTLVVTGAAATLVVTGADSTYVGPATLV